MRRRAVAVVSLAAVAVSLATLAAARPRARTVTILFTADTLGELVPCGCARRGGGLSPRAGLVRQLRAAFPDLLLLETGNLARSPQQLAVVARSLRRMGYLAAGVGQADAELGDSYLRVARSEGILALDGSAAREIPPIRRYLVHRAGGIRVAVTATGPTPSDGGFPDDRQERLASTLREARTHADLLIVLTDASRASAERLLESPGLPAVDLVLAGEAAAVPSRARPGASRTRIVAARPLGETAVRLDVTFSPGGAPEFRAASLPIDARWRGDAAIDVWCREYVRQQTKRVTVVAGRSPDAASVGLASFDYVERTPAGTVVHRAPNFLDAGQCGSCHTEALRIWRASAHARAYATLKARDRLIPDCLPCHSETFRRLEARENPASGGSGVECSTCHGPGLTHRRTNGALGTVLRGGDDAATEALCRRCHTPAQSPEFRFREYLARIHH
jgi:hypothetical protein